MNLVVLWLFTKVFSVKSEGGVLWCSTSEQSAKFSQQKLYFLPIRKKCFSLISFLLYALLQN